jgi:hypothetical protein
MQRDYNQEHPIKPSAPALYLRRQQDITPGQALAAIHCKFLPEQIDDVFLNTIPISDNNPGDDEGKHDHCNFQDDLACGFFMAILRFHFNRLL